MTNETSTALPQGFIDPRIDFVARVIAAAIWRPQPDMSGDLWRSVSSHRRRQAEDAAAAVLEAIMQQGIPT